MGFDPEILDDRGSAVIGLVLGIVVFTAGLYASATGAMFKLAIWALVLGPALVMAAAAKLRTMSPRPAGRLMAGKDARALVEIQPLPFGVCTGCNALHEQNAGECLHCNRRVDYLEVRSEDDRKTAIAAIVLD